MWLSASTRFGLNCMLDLYETLPPEARDNKLSLVYKMNTDNFVAVNTAGGQTERVNIRNIVMQGGKWGPLKCSNSMDKIGRKSVEKGKNLYTYKGKVKIMPLAMVDDLLAVAKCGNESIDVNISINAEIECKKLRFHTPDTEGKSKCHVLHIGKKVMDCHDLAVHGCPMEVVDSDVYLGDIISSNGKNSQNIESRVAKGLGIVSQILDLLKTVSFGIHFFEIAASLREAMLVNGLLTNCEVWHGITEGEVSKLEEVDRLLLRQVFQVASSCPTEALYLELGCIPLGLVIKSRRISYLHHLSTRNESEMLAQVFRTQWNYPVGKNEWSEQVRLDLVSFGISENLEWIRSKTKISFKTMLKKKTRELALLTLNKMKEGHSKMDNLVYLELAIQSYLKDKRNSVEEARILFRFRTRMSRCWENFKGGRPPQTCPVCKDSTSIDTQIHSFQCGVIKENISISGTYEDIFKTTTDKEVVKTIRILQNSEKKC